MKHREFKDADFQQQHVWLKELRTDWDRRSRADFVLLILAVGLLWGLIFWAVWGFLQP